MKLTDVRSLLRQTIYNKKAYLADLAKDQPATVAERQTRSTVVQVLDINIAELERILVDLDRCDQL